MSQSTPAPNQTDQSAPGAEIWVFGDYRNYFQNRVTLQLLARARELATPLQAPVCALVMGSKVDEWVGEYGAHGADKVYVWDQPSLRRYQVETYAHLAAQLAHRQKPQIFLLGATDFGKDLAARLAALLGTGLTADCVDLSLDEQQRLVQTAPSFGGNLLAEILIPRHRPQMATVRPGTFQELPHDYERRAQVIRLELPADLPPERLRVVSSRRAPRRGEQLERARVVVCGGRGLGSKAKFAHLLELAALLGAEVGATRPAVYARWVGEEALVGQAGKQIKPKVLLSFGISGAIQHTAGIQGAEFILAVNKNPAAQMMKMADVAIVGDASQVCLALIKLLKTMQPK